MIRIYINGEETNWKRIKEEYGENYCNELKEEIENAAPYARTWRILSRNAREGVRERWQLFR